MSANIPNLTPRDPNPEHVRLKTMFEDLRKEQLTFLNEAGKRVIELSTGMLGILFAVVAFGKDFPPPYLQADLTKVMAVVTLLFFFLALAAGIVCVQPRSYRYNPNDPQDMQEEWEKANRFKALWFRLGSILFGLGSLWLAVLIAAIIFNLK